MKKGWKIFWTACAVTAGIGIVCCVSGAAMGATMHSVKGLFPLGLGTTDDAQLYAPGETAEDAQSQSYQGIESIELDAGRLEVQILPGGAEKEVRVETKEISQKLNIRVEQEGNRLKIETGEKHAPWRAKGGRYGAVWIYVPENLVLQDADLELGKGSLYVQNIHAEELKVDVGAGLAVLDDFTAGRTELSVGVGNLEAKGSTEKEAKLECDVGRIAYKDAGRETDFNYQLECGMGEIKLGGAVYSGLSVEQSIENRAAKNMNIDCNLGNAEVTFEN